MYTYIYIHIYIYIHVYILFAAKRGLYAHTDVCIFISIYLCNIHKYIYT